MESIGAKLKNLRLQKGLSLEDAHKKTKIHLDILKAIEEDSLINFSPVYIKGFLKIYCNFLGIDPRECLPDYKDPQAKVKYVHSLEGKPARSFKFPAINLSFLKFIRIKPKVLVTVALIVVSMAGLFNLGKIISSKAKARHTQESQQARGIIAPKTQNRPIQAVKSVNSIVAKTITLDIHARDNCFIQVKADGRVIFQNILKKGRSESWHAKDKIELSLGNAGSVDLEVNGKRISSLGRKGQALKNILITKEGLDIKR